MTAALSASCASASGIIWLAKASARHEVAETYKAVNAQRLEDVDLADSAPGVRKHPQLLVRE